MADGKKLGDLTQISTITGTEIMYLVKTGIDYKVTLNQIKTFLGKATQALDGLMSKEDKRKLDGIADNATANSSDEYLLNLENSTGSLSVNRLAGSIDYESLTNTPDLTALSTYNNLSGKPINYATGEVVMPILLNVAASGTTQAEATPVAGYYVQVTGVTAETANGVRINTSTVGNVCKIRNSTGSSLNVYPPVGMAINGQGTNLPLEVAAYETVEFINVTSTGIVTVG